MANNFTFEAEMGIFYNPIFNLLALLFPTPPNVVFCADDLVCEKVNEYLTIIKTHDFIVAMNIHYVTVLFPHRLVYGCNSDNKQLVLFLQQYLIRQGYFLNEYNQEPQYSIEIVHAVTIHPTLQHLLITTIYDHFNVKHHVVTNNCNIEQNDVVVYARLGTWLTNGSQIKPQLFGEIVSEGILCAPERFNLQPTSPNQAHQSWILPSRYVAYVHQAFWKVEYEFN